jgi:carbamoyl-phosphate synthase large subunit
MVSYVIATAEKGRRPTEDSLRINRKALEMHIPCVTSIDTANALFDCLLSSKTIHDVELVDMNKAFANV